MNALNAPNASTLCALVHTPSHTSSFGRRGTNGREERTKQRHMPYVAAAGFSTTPSCLLAVPSLVCEGLPLAVH